jgi:hypothetical protein
MASPAALPPAIARALSPAAAPLAAAASTVLARHHGATKRTLDLILNPGIKLDLQ